MVQRGLAICAVLLAMLAMPLRARADDDDAPGRARNPLNVDTEHIFGFVEGSDIGDVGDKEFEKESAARFGKSGGRYAAISTLFDFKYVPFENVLISPGVLISYHGINAVPDMMDREQISLQGLSFQLKYLLLDRTRAPFGLTVFAEPHWNRVDEASGERVSQYGADFTIAADKEIITDRLYGVVNLFYQAEVSRAHDTGERERDSTIGIGAGLGAQVLPGVVIGAEARYLRAHEELIPRALKGDALFVGPTFHTRLSPNTFMAVAWGAQVVGHAVGEPGRLDLTNFSRHQMRLRLGIEF